MPRSKVLNHFPCPKCGGHSKNATFDSQKFFNKMLHRYRQCKVCDYTFRTVEIVRPLEAKNEATILRELQMIKKEAEAVKYKNRSEGQKARELAAITR